MLLLESATPLELPQFPQHNPSIRAVHIFFLTTKDDLAEIRNIDTLFIDYPTPMP